MSANATTQLKIRCRTPLALTRRARRALLSLLLPLGLGASPALAGEVFALGSTSFSPNQVMSLYRIDTATGAATLVGSTGAVGLRGLAAHPTTGRLYSSYGASDAGSNFGLVEIDPVTAAVTPIGGADRFTALSFDSTGQLYGISNPHVGATITDLRQIDETTGSSTFVSDIHLHSTGLAFDSANNLYAKDGNSLFSVSLPSGSFSFLGNFNAAVPTASMVFDDADNLLTSARPSDGSGWYAVDLMSMTATLLGNTGIFIRGLAAGETELTLTAAKDSFLRRGNPDRNEGANPGLRLQASGDNRVVVGFDQGAIDDFGDVTTATLVLTISENADNWGQNSDRTVDAHPLSVDFAEGNGQDAGVPPAQSTRGSGPGVTWNCAEDAEIANQRTDCASKWNGGNFGPAIAPPVLHVNGLSGDISWDVTDDVLAGATAWLIKKTSERQAGRVSYHSREGADPDLAPRLILEK